MSDIDTEYKILFVTVLLIFILGFSVYSSYESNDVYYTLKKDSTTRNKLYYDPETNQTTVFSPFTNLTETVLNILRGNIRR